MQLQNPGTEKADFPVCPVVFLRLTHLLTAGFFFFFSLAMKTFQDTGKLAVLGQCSKSLRSA